MYTRPRNPTEARRSMMNRTNLLSGTLRRAALLIALIALVLAQIPSHSAQKEQNAALIGKVTSNAESAMEGVIVGAKLEGSTITTWVVSNAQGQYSFPRDRMEPGKYAIKIRAVGYELPNTSVDVATQTTRLDLQLNKVTS